MKSWLLPCNPKYYDIKGVYENLKTVDWKQSVSKAEVGDLAYIYVSAPIGAVAYKCEVVAVNKAVPTVDDRRFHINAKAYAEYGKYMELKFIGSYDREELGFAALGEHGLKGRVQCQRSIDGELKDYIEEMTA